MTTAPRCRRRRPFPSLHQKLAALTAGCLLGASCLFGAAASAPAATPALAAESAQPFGADFPQLDSLAVGEWWTKRPAGANPPPKMEVPRDEVVAFALYTQARGVLKLTAQLFPLKPGEVREARLELQRGGQWVEVAKTPVVFPGWSAHFRVEQWDARADVAYRVRHGEKAMFDGLIRKDPLDKNEIVVATMSCNSSRTTGLRPEIIDSLTRQNPDLLFFAGDQTYRHTEHTAGWIEFGLQFRDVMRNRPTIAVPDDHDVGHPNLWGANGKFSQRKDGADGGYFFSVDYVNMVQRQQTWHLPDPVDPAPVERGIGVYFTRLHVGGVDFAILEDRKFKTGPAGAVPQLGPRPDHINDPSYDPASIDVPGLQLLGARQMRFLRDWGQDWTGTTMKVVLSQTAFAGAVHLHGPRQDRLLADLDCNGWPQTQRNLALAELRRAQATHLCGDQHLAVVVKHGIDAHGDGPYAFTNPALVNTIYGRWWSPLEGRAGENRPVNNPLPWTGDYRDGLGNRITMLAYANPTDIQDEKQRADGYGLARFNRRTQQIVFECWPRFALPGETALKQFPGWPITVKMADNDGRKPAAYLPAIVSDTPDPVVQVIAEATGEILYTLRIAGTTFQPAVFAPGVYTVKLGRDKPDGPVLTGLRATAKAEAGERRVKLGAARN